MIRHSRQVFQYKYRNNYFLLYPKLYGDIKSKSPENEQQIINNAKKTLESINSWSRSFPQAAVNKIRVGGVPLWESKISKKDFGKIKDHLLELQVSVYLCKISREQVI